MSENKEKKNGLSESFVIGTIAIVFLMVGYQTALFIHQAAVTRIAANRDEPDTVYIYMEKPDDGDESVGKSHIQKTERHNSAHSSRAEAVRHNAPRSKTESFRFDPNTVSVEELCRLGFTPKQAQSIDNYRRKGGRFRRKSDFAKSYVVSDSIFRRLEPYIDIPLVDLNTADSAAFDALPGIGGWFAQKMLEHRKALGGYSYKVSDHSFNPDKTYGYRFFDDNQKFQQALFELYENEVKESVKNGLQGAIYTQVSDVEDETKGLLTYDRQVLKVDKHKMYNINQMLYRAFEESLN